MLQSKQRIIVLFVRLLSIVWCMCMISFWLVVFFFDLTLCTLLSLLCLLSVDLDIYYYYYCSVFMCLISLPKPTLVGCFSSSSSSHIPYTRCSL